jgi:hypothetical protein
MTAPFVTRTRTYPQQGSSQARRARRDRIAARPGSWRAGRPAHAAPLLAGLALLGVGCGAVEFVPSPYTPQNVDLIYSTQEDITIVRWRVSSTSPGSDLGFQILLDNGYTPIDFLTSVYPGGAAPCSDGKGTCYQYVVRGNYPVATRNHPIQGDHSLYGILPGGLATASTLDTTLSFVSFFHTNNDEVFVNIDDVVAGNGAFPRQFMQSMWPTSGLCVSSAPPDGATFAMLDPTISGFLPPMTLTPQGIYCVGLRPIPNDGGDGALAQTRIETVPSVVDMSQTYVPKVQDAPIVYQIILDLEIPIADRCTSALSTIESLVDKYMNMPNEPVPVHKLDTINLAVDPTGTASSPNCKQQDGRSLTAADMAQKVFQIISGSPQVHQQFHFFYFNNLNSPLPQTLTDSLTSLFSDLQNPPPPYDLRLFSWLWNPGLAAATGPSWWQKQAWQAADDPTFEKILAAYAMQNLPYRTQVQDPGTPVPLLAPDVATQDDGDQIKICTSSIYVEPADTNTNPVQVFPYANSWEVVAATPPGFLVSLPPQISVPYNQFVQESVDIDYQVCTAYCDSHPFVSKAGTPVSSWDTSYLCAGPNN